eukprot:Em0003g609a
MYEDVLADKDEELGRTAVVQHSIVMGDAPPIKQPSRPIPVARQHEVRKLLDEILQKDVIQPSASPWASPVVLVQKKDGTMWFCIDYRKLNAVTRKDAYPLPRIDETLEALGGSKWFSTLDLLSGYWQVEVSEQDRLKTAFSTREGLFEFKMQASTGLGAVLSQVVNGCERVVTYASRIVNKAERKGRDHGNADALSRSNVHPGQEACIASTSATAAARHVAAVPRTTGPYRDQRVMLVTIGSACVPNQDAGHGLVAVPGDRKVERKLLDIVVPLPIWSVLDRLMKKCMPSSGPADVLPGRVVPRVKPPVLEGNFADPQETKEAEGKGRSEHPTVVSFQGGLPQPLQHVTQHLHSQRQSCGLEVDGLLEALDTPDGKSQRWVTGSGALVPHGVVQE